MRAVLRHVAETLARYDETLRPGDRVICGSSLFGGSWPHGRQVSIRLGALDGDPGIRPQFHTFVDSRAPWDEITDDLPQCPGAWTPDAPAGG